MSSQRLIVRRAPDTRGRQRHDRPETPAPRQLAAYRCARGHDFEVTFSAEAELPQEFSCRCGAASQLGGHDTAGPAGPASERARCLAQLLARRTLAELEQLLRDRLAELAAARKTTRL